MLERVYLLQPSAGHFGKRAFGAASENMMAIGIYLHGLFENDSFRRYFLDFLRTRQGLEPAKKNVSYRAFRKEQLDRPAGWISDNADIPGLLSLMGL